MDLSVQKINNVNNNFTAMNINEEELKKHPVVIDNTFSNRMYIGWDKFTNALTMYPARGLKGSKNSNFYEFLTMGIIPYIAGSATLMAIFNTNSKFLARDKKMASQIGKKMALGVLFYGLAKSLSKNLITYPVKWLTGVDTEEPYAELKFKLPENISDTDITSLEYHKVLESVDFPRWNVKYGDESKNEPRNMWFDKIAEKTGLGKDLKDSDQDVKPLVKEIAVKSSLAKSISSYMWAAVGVAMAMQKTWDGFFNMATINPLKFKQFAATIGRFIDSVFTSIGELYRGPKNAGSFFKQHSGKMLIGVAAFSTVAGLANVLLNRNKPSRLTSNDVIDKNRKFVVD